jgi:hypothetical protein
VANGNPCIDFVRGDERCASLCSVEIQLEKLAAEPIVGLDRKDYSEYYRVLDRIFAPVHAKPRIAVECDSVSSLITEVEADAASLWRPRSSSS